MTRLKTPDIDGSRRPEKAESREVRKQSEAAPSLAAGEESADFTAFLSQARDMSRFLNGFTAPEGFRPAPPVPVLSLSPEKARDLGASSLKDFFALALEREERPSIMARAAELPEFFPKGPESIRPALDFLDLEIKRLTREVDHLERIWPVRQPGFEKRVRPLENSLAVMAESRANLMRAGRLWARMKEDASVWPKEAKYLWQKAQRLHEAITLLLNAAREIEEHDGRSACKSGRRSLTRSAVELKTEVGLAKAVLTDETHWLDGLGTLASELDDILAVVVDGSQLNRDLNGDTRRMSARLTDLEREDRRLKDESLRVGENLKKALGALSDTESHLAGRQGIEMLDRLESAGRGIEALWRSTTERRRDLARVYFLLPGRLGQPEFLDKVFQVTAQALGRTQALLEDLRHRLSLAGGRLSTTHRLRGEGQILIDRLERVSRRAAGLRTARKRLGVLAWVVDQRLSLQEAKGALEEALARGREAEKELTQGRAENSRMNRELAAAALEKERLAEQLAETWRGLSDAGLAKARLLKVYERKNELLEQMRRSKSQLAEENEQLKTERAELRRKRTQLAGLYTRERDDLKKLTAELRASQGELAQSQEFIAQRRDLEARLDATRQERAALENRRREVETQLEERSHGLAAAEARTATLEAELNRHREELAEASRSRLRLGEQTAVLRHRLELLSQAQGSLKKTLERRSRRGARSDAELEGMSGLLTRRKRNLMQLVAARQELRSELGSARLKLTDLEKEREAILAQLDAAQALAGETDREKQELKSLLADLGIEKSALSDQLTALESEKADLEKTRDVILGRLTEARTQTGESDREKNELRVRLEELGVEKSALSNQLTALESEKAGLAGRLTGLEEEKAVLEREREGILARLEEAGAQAGESDREKQELRASLEELSGENSALSGQLVALEAEKAGLTGRLTGLEDEKADLEREREGILSRLEEAKAQAGERDREKSELRSSLEELGIEKSALLDKLSALESEKAGLTGRLTGLEDEKADLERERATILRRLEDAQTQTAGETDREKQELRSSLEELSGENSALSGQLTALEAEKAGLAGRLTGLEDEKADLANRLDALNGENGRLAELETEKANLNSRLAGLENEKNRTALKLVELEDQNLSLTEQLSELETRVSSDLAPFIQILGQALWQSEDQLQKARSASGELAEKVQMEADVHLARMRLQAANREIAYTEQARLEHNELKETLEARDVDLNQAHEALVALQRSRDDLENERATLGRNNQAMTETLSRFDGRSRKLRQALGTLKNRYRRRLEESRLTEEGLTGLLERQGRTMEDQKARLAQLEPLVAHFFDSAFEMTAPVNNDGASTVDMALVGYLKEESRTLQGELVGAEGREDARFLSAGAYEIDQLVDLRELKERLEQLRPLVAFLARSFVTGVAELAQARQERCDLSDELTDAQKWHSAAKGELAQVRQRHSEVADELDQSRQEQLAMADELDEARRERSSLNEELSASRRGRLTLNAELAQVKREHSAASAELAQARQDCFTQANELILARHEAVKLENEMTQVEQERFTLTDDLAKTRQERTALAGQLALVGSTREVLENSLLSREAELSEVRGQALALARERDHLQGDLSQKDDEVSTLKSELAQADRDLTENDGRLEAAWAAMNYLGTRAGDTLGHLKDKLEQRARQMGDLTLDLENCEKRIKQLEERQNKLALLYWILVARTMETTIPVKATVLQPAPPAEIISEPPAPSQLENGIPAVFHDNAANSGGHSLGRGFLEGVKKVARRSLFTFLLAGGLVMTGSFPAAAAVGAAPEMPAVMRPAPASEGPYHLLSRLDSNYIGRPVSMEAVDSETRLAGRPAVENRLAEMVTELADGQGLTSGEFLRLVRAARGPESTVHLSDFSGLEGGLTLLETHTPKMAKLLKKWPADIFRQGKLTALMKNAADFRPAEGGFWERLFFDFLAVQSQNDALNSLLARLAEKKELAGQARPEFAGRLAPFPQLENLGPDRFISFMAGHINSNWSSLSGRGRHQASRRLAGDIYFSARLFKLPVTLLASLIQEESEADGVDFFRRGATSALYDRAADLVDLVRDYTLSWQEGRPPLCDLDEALAASEKEAFMEAVYHKKMALVMAFNKSLNTGQTLLVGLDDD